VAPLPARAPHIGAGPAVHLEAPQLRKGALAACGTHVPESLIATQPAVVWLSRWLAEAAADPPSAVNLTVPGAGWQAAGGVAAGDPHKTQWVRTFILRSQSASRGAPG
jgi:hypothetical protein